MAPSIAAPSSLWLSIYAVTLVAGRLLFWMTREREAKTGKRASKKALYSTLVLPRFSFAFGFFCSQAPEFLKGKRERERESERILVAIQGWIQPLSGLGDAIKVTGPWYQRVTESEAREDGRPPSPDGKQSVETRKDILLSNSEWKICILLVRNWRTSVFENHWKNL